MSELTSCNYCNLKRMRERHKKDGMKITLLRKDNWAPGFPKGVTVYVHPKDIKIKELYKVAREKFFVAWFMELGDKCCC